MFTKLCFCFVVTLYGVIVFTFLVFRLFAIPIALFLLFLFGFLRAGVRLANMRKLWNPCFSGYVCLISLHSLAVMFCLGFSSGVLLTYLSVLLIILVLYAGFEYSGGKDIFLSGFSLSIIRVLVVGLSRLSLVNQVPLVNCFCELLLK